MIMSHVTSIYFHLNNTWKTIIKCLVCNWPITLKVAPAPIRRMCVSVPRNKMAFMKSINFNENNNLSVGYDGMFEFEVTCLK